jgi:hypothetical protein
VRGGRWLATAAVVAATLLALPVHHARAQGIYDLTTDYAGSVADTRGWTVQWRVPGLANPDQGAGVIGQWYFNLEAGLYRTGDGWFAYFFGDDDGLEVGPGCEAMWDTGALCGGGPFAALGPGATLGIAFEFCRDDRTPDVNGSRLCLWFDLADGGGRRFMAITDRSTVEMYSHVEYFEGLPELLIPCDSPAVMLGQYVKGTDGNWQALSGMESWRYSPAGGHYHRRNFFYWHAPATWEICSGPGPGPQPQPPPPALPPPPAVQRDTTPPVLSAVALTRRRFRVGRRPTAIESRRRRPRGTTLRYTLSEPARLVSVEFVRLERGRVEVSGRCAWPSPRLRRQRAKRCTRQYAAGLLTRHDRPAGPGAIAFSGRVGSRPLLPGRYRAVVHALDGALNRAAPVTLKFTVLRR